MTIFERFVNTNQSPGKIGEPWNFGNDSDSEVVASSTEVSDRKAVDADDEYEIFLRNGEISFERNAFRSAVIQWTVKQTFTKRSFENIEPDDEPSEDDFFTLQYEKEFVEVPFLRDLRTGAVIVNSAGDAFIPTPTRKEAIRCFALTRKERKNNCKMYDMYENVVNEDRWHDFGPGTVLMESITPNWDGHIFTTTYKFKYNRNGWGEKYLGLLPESFIPFYLA